MTQKVWSNCITSCKYSDLERVGSGKETGSLGTRLAFHCLFASTTSKGYVYLKRTAEGNLNIQDVCMTHAQLPLAC